MLSRLQDRYERQVVASMGPRIGEEDARRLAQQQLRLLVVEIPALGGLLLIGIAQMNGYPPVTLVGGLLLLAVGVPLYLRERLSYRRIRRP